MLRRPRPRLGVALAGVGIVVAVLGVVVWSGDYLAGSGAGENGPSGSHRLLGVGLSLVATAIGYLLAVRVRRGPLAAAGVVASALGVPVLLGFLTFSTDEGFPPFSLDAVVLVSIAVWVVSYFWIPGTRGHGLYLGLAATLLWLYAVDKSEPAAFGFPALTNVVARDGILYGGGGGPDWGTVATLSIVFGVGYYLVLAVLDRTGRAGTATPFAVSGFVATGAGIAATAPSWHANGVGALLIVFGLGLGALGARTARRFTTWVWAAAVGAGIVVLIGDAVPDNAAGAGISLIVCGLFLAVVGTMVALVLREPSDDAALADGHPGAH